MSPIDAIIEDNSILLKDITIKILENELTIENPKYNNGVASLSFVGEGEILKKLSAVFKMISFSPSKTQYFGKITANGFGEIDYEAELNGSSAKIRIDGKPHPMRVSSYKINISRKGESASATIKVRWEKTR